jgi:hypothetical protein
MVAHLTPVCGRHLWYPFVSQCEAVRCRVAAAHDSTSMSIHELESEVIGDRDDSVRSTKGLAMSLLNGGALSIRDADKFFIGGRWVEPSSAGGFKQSGVGREGGVEGLLPFVETKTVILEGWPAQNHEVPS